MSLEPEKLQQLIDVQKETLQLVKKTIEAVNTVKGELEDLIADNHKESLQKIHELHAFAKNILEVNQKTIWKKLLELAAEEEETIEPTQEPA